MMSVAGYWVCNHQAFFPWRRFLDMWCYRTWLPMSIFLQLAMYFVFFWLGYPEGRFGAPNSGRIIRSSDVLACS